MPEILGRECELGSRHPHGSNIHKKLNDRDAANDQNKLRLIQDIATRYLNWRDAALSVDFSDERLFVERQTLLYQDHRDFLDEPRIDAFDSRGLCSLRLWRSFATSCFGHSLSNTATPSRSGITMCFRECISLRQTSMNSL